MVLILTLVLNLILITFFNTFFINNHLRKQLIKISLDTEVIANGNLDHRITLQRSDEFQALSDRINKMTDNIVLYTRQLEAANSELEAFSYSVSHDLRAPLRHINGFVELLEKRDTSGLDEKSRHYLRVIAKAARNMGELIDDLLNFSRMGKVEMVRTNVNLTQLVSEAQCVLKSHFDGLDILWEI